MKSPNRHPGNFLGDSCGNYNKYERVIEREFAADLYICAELTQLLQHIENNLRCQL